MGFALEAAQTCKPGAVCRPRGTSAFGDQKGHPPSQWVPSGSIPSRGSRRMLGVHWDEQHPPAEDQSRVQAGSRAERANPTADPAAHARAPILRSVMRSGIFGGAGWLLGSWVLKNP